MSTAAPLTIDQAAVDARKPRAGPLVEPAEAVAIALSVTEWRETILETYMQALGML